MMKQRKWMALLLTIAMSMSIATGCGALDDAGVDQNDKFTNSAASEQSVEAAEEAVNNDRTVDIAATADVFVPEQVPSLSLIHI